MDFSKLSQNDKLAVYGAAAVVVAGVIAAATYTFYSTTWLAIIIALGMLFVVFQPQVASTVNLPGTKGSLMLLLGGAAGVVMVLALLMSLRLIFIQFGLPDVMFLIAVAGGLLMAWAGWQAFQAEGGKFQLGSSSPGAPASTPTQPPPSTPAATPETSTPPPADPDKDRRTEI